MPLRDNERAKKFLDEVDGPLTLRRTMTARGDCEYEIEIGATDNLIALAEAAKAAGFQLIFDGGQIRVDYDEGERLAPQEET